MTAYWLNNRLFLPIISIKCEEHMPSVAGLRPRITWTWAPGRAAE